MEVRLGRVSTLARLVIARERARIMRTRRPPNDSSDLEQAAAQWQRQREQEKRGIRGINQRSTSQ